MAIQVNIRVNEAGQRVVSLKELCYFLGVQTQLGEWVRRKAKHCNMLEGKDFKRISVKSPGMGRSQIDYEATLQTAYNFCVVEKGKMAEEARDVFFNAMQSTAMVLQEPKREMSKAEMLLESATLLVEHEKKLDEHGRRITVLEDHVATEKRIREEASKILLELPQPTVESPEPTKRKIIWDHINRYSAINKLDFRITWLNFFKAFGLAAGLNIPNHKGLEYIEAKGKIEQAYAYTQKHYKI